jgi:hypothetical protein
MKNFKERNLGDLDVDGTILNFVLKKQAVRV